MVADAAVQMNSLLTAGQAGPMYQPASHETLTSSPETPATDQPVGPQQAARTAFVSDAATPWHDTQPQLQPQPDRAPSQQAGQQPMHASSGTQSEAAVAIGTPLLRSAGPAQALSGVSLPEALVEEALVELQSRYRQDAAVQMLVGMGCETAILLAGSFSRRRCTCELADSCGCTLQDTGNQQHSWVLKACFARTLSTCNWEQRCHWPEHPDRKIHDAQAWSGHSADSNFSPQPVQLVSAAQSGPEQHHPVSFPG